MSQLTFESSEDSENLKLVDNYYELYEKLILLESQVDFSLSITVYLSCKLGIVSGNCEIPAPYKPIDAKAIVANARNSSLAEKDQPKTSIPETSDSIPSLTDAQFSFETEEERKQVFKTPANLETVNFVVTTRNKTLKQRAMELDSLVVQLNQRLTFLNSLNLELYSRLQKQQNGSDPFVLQQDPFAITAKTV